MPMPNTQNHEYTVRSTYIQCRDIHIEYAKYCTNDRWNEPNVRRANERVREKFCGKKRVQSIKQRYFGNNSCASDYMCCVVSSYVCARANESFLVFVCRTWIEYHVKQYAIVLYRAYICACACVRSVLGRNQPRYSSSRPHENKSIHNLFYVLQQNAGIFSFIFRRLLSLLHSHRLCPPSSPSPSPSPALLSFSSSFWFHFIWVACALSLIVFDVYIRRSRSRFRAQTQYETYKRTYSECGMCIVYAVYAAVCCLTSNVSNEMVSVYVTMASLAVNSIVQRNWSWCVDIEMERQATK